MTRFTITFAVSLPLTADRDLSERKGKRNSKQASKVNKKWSTLTAEVPKNVIDLGKLLTEMHVEYELLPGRKFQFDCRSWQSIAKVYMADGVLLINPKFYPEHENQMWIIFSVYHGLELNLSELRDLYRHTIVWSVSFGSAKLSSKAKKDMAKKVVLDENENTRLEIKSSANIPSAEPKTVAASVENENQTEKAEPAKSYVHSVPEAAHVNKLLKLIKTTAQSVSPRMQSQGTYIESKMSDVTLSKKSGKSKSRKKKATNEPYKLEVPGSELFAEMGPKVLYQAMPAPNILSISAIINSEDIMRSKDIRAALNPLSIKLEKLENFPSDDVVEEGFTETYAKVTIADLVFSTPRQSLQPTVHFDYTKCYLYEEFQSNRLISALATENLVVEIYGIRYEKSVPIQLSSVASDRTTKSSKKGQKRAKRSKTPTSQRPLTTELLLGAAHFDLSDLLKGYWEVCNTNGLIHPRSLPFSNEMKPNGNLLSLGNSPPTCEMYISNSTSVKLRVRLASGLGKAHSEARRQAHALNRMLLILCDKDFGNDLLDNVDFHNKEVLKTDRVITGFAIDCVDRMYIFFEGLINGSYFHKIWDQSMTIDTSRGCVLYNSDFVFLHRLYADFEAVGIVRLNLREPLEDQLRNCGFYVGSGATSSRARILKSVGLIKLASTMRSICQSHLIPTASVVTNFDIYLAGAYLYEEPDTRKKKAKRGCSTKDTGQQIVHMK